MSTLEKFAKSFTTIRSSILKRFVGWGIGSGADPFSRAVLRMTLYYALAALLILVLYSALIYVLYIRVLPPEYDIEPDTHTVSMLEEFRTEPIAHELRENLIHLLIYTDILLFLVSVAIGHALSRATLAPIRVMHDRQRSFVAMAAHELRTPVAVLLAGADHMTARSRSVSEYAHYIQVVQTETRGLRVLVNDLLYLAQHDAGAPSAHLLVNVSQVVRDTCAAMVWYAEEHDCTIVVDAKDDAPVSGSADHLVRVVQNLVKNAIDYNTPRGTVTVRVFLERDAVVLQVSDTGVGIPAEKQQAVFERFVTGEVASAARGKGTGLGLAIVRATVQEHGGTVTLESAVGQGSSFTVRLPRAC